MRVRETLLAHPNDIPAVFPKRNNKKYQITETPLNLMITTKKIDVEIPPCPRHQTYFLSFSENM